MPKKELSLDDILTRKRRLEASKKASEIMGKGARRSGETVKVVPVKGASGKGAATAVPDGKWRHDLHHKVNPNASRVSKLPTTTLSPAITRSLQGNRLFAALHSDQTQTVSTGAGRGATGGAGKGGGGPAKDNNNNNKGGGLHIRGSATAAGAAGGGGFSIKGSAGPAVVQASNFAPGTTAEDIRHAMEPLGRILSCIILTFAPTVICEIVFEQREAGEKCVQQYNSMKADGRVLHVSFKDGPPVAPISAESRDPFAEREEADRRRREQNIYFQDGRWGVKPPPMYSDALIQKGRGFGGY